MYANINSHLGKKRKKQRNKQKRETDLFMCAEWVKPPYVQSHIIPQKERWFHEKSALTVNTNSVGTSQIWQWKRALRSDPNNHQNKVCQLFGTVQRRSMGNWTGYEKHVVFSSLSTAHFDVSYRTEMNGKWSSAKMKERVCESGGWGGADKQRE